MTKNAIKKALEAFPEVAEAVFTGIYEAVTKRGVYLAAQCCCREVEQKVIYQVVIIANEGVVRLFLNEYLDVAINSLMTSGISLARYVDNHSLCNTCRNRYLDNFLTLDNTRTATLVALVLDNGTFTTTGGTNALRLHHAEDALCGVGDNT